MFIYHLKLFIYSIISYHMLLLKNFFFIVIQNSLFTILKYTYLGSCFNELKIIDVLLSNIP